MSELNIDGKCAWLPTMIGWVQIPQFAFDLKESDKAKADKLTNVRRSRPYKSKCDNPQSARRINKDHRSMSGRSEGENLNPVERQSYEYW